MKCIKKELRDIENRIVRSKIHLIESPKEVNKENGER